MTAVPAGAEHIVEVQEQIGEGLDKARKGREGLGRAQRQFVNCSLGIQDKDQAGEAQQG